MIEITLKGYEIMQGALAGVMRNLESVKRGMQNAHGLDGGNDWQCHIEGSLGEMALAKYMNLYWSKGDFKAPDVGNFEVRTTPKHNYKLCVRPGDHDDSRYYLVTGSNGTYRIQGWILGRDAKQDRFLDDLKNGRPPAYFIPQKELNKP